MRPTVLLFDIDGTLLDTGGAGRRAMERAFEARHGRRDACATLAFGGMTDRAIARGGLDAIAADTSERSIDALLAVYLENLADELARTDRCKIHDGIVAALDAAVDARCAVGLGTGNIEPGAHLKLERVGLAKRFAFGGFGSDHEIRSELLRVGAERGARALGAPVDACRVVVIGDTPRDVSAALAIRAECLAVSTGPYPADALAGATWIFRDLRDEGALEALLQGAR